MSGVKIPRKTRIYFFRATALFVSLTLPFSGSSFAAAEPEIIAASRTSQIPPAFGRIDESYQGTNGKTVFYIQDAHDSLEAQENIAEIIAHFVEHEGVKTVFEEGYEGDVPTDEYFGFIQGAASKKKTAYFLLDKLRIGGAEYAHVNRSRDFRLIGADSLALHRENLEWYRRSAAEHQLVSEDLKRITQDLEKLANRLFPGEMKDWMKLRARFEEGKLDLVSYLARTAALKKEILSGPGFENLNLLLRAAAENNPAQDEVPAIDPRSVFVELDRLENEIALAFLAGSREREIYRFNKELRLLARLNSIAITASEYEALEEIIDEFDTAELAAFIAKESGISTALPRRWEESIRFAREFYRTAQARDEIVKNRLASFLPSAEVNAVLVFGGFHKPAILRILRDAGYSYQVVTPAITEISEKHQEYYRRLMGTGYHAFETPLIAARAARTANIYGVPFGRRELTAVAEAVAFSENAGDRWLAAAEEHLLARSELRPESQTVESGLSPLPAGTAAPKEYLRDYKYDPGLGRDVIVAVTVKNNEQSATDERALRGLTRADGHLIGGVTARPYKEGLVLGVPLSQDSVDAGKALWSFSTAEPHSVSFHGDTMAVGGNNTVTVYDSNGKAPVQMMYPWFAHVHTASFSEDGKNLLVASSGFDSAFEINIASALVTWEWKAWENGYDRSPLGHHLTTSPERAVKLRESGKEAILVDDPSAWPAFGLPTRQRAVHLNGAEYLDADRLLLTLFHQGQAIIVDRGTGASQIVMEGLMSPHGFSKAANEEYVIASTRSAHFYILDSDFRARREISLEDMPGIVRPPELGEWLQNVQMIGPNLFLGIDIHRRHFWVIDIQHKTYRGIEIPRDWAVQETVVLPEAWQKKSSDYFLTPTIQVELKNGARSELRSRPEDAEAKLSGRFNPDRRQNTLPDASGDPRKKARHPGEASELTGTLAELRAGRFSAAERRLAAVFPGTMRNVDALDKARRGETYAPVAYDSSTPPSALISPAQAASAVAELLELDYSGTAQVSGTDLLGEALQIEKNTERYNAAYGLPLKLETIDIAGQRPAKEVPKAKMLSLVSPPLDEAADSLIRETPDNGNPRVFPAVEKGAGTEARSELRAGRQASVYDELEKEEGMEVMRGGTRTVGSSPDEVLALVDLNGRRLRQTKPKDQAHRDGDWHETAHVYVFDKKGRLLLQKRSLDKKTSPGKFQVSVSGHVNAHEGVRKAAAREGTEEIGIQINPRRLKRMGRVKREYDTAEGHNREFTTIYAYTVTDEEKKTILGNYNLNESDEIWVWPVDTMLKWVESNPELFSNSIRLIAGEEKPILEKMLKDVKAARSELRTESTGQEGVLKPLSEPAGVILSAGDFLLLPEGAADARLEELLILLTENPALDLYVDGHEEAVSDDPKLALLDKLLKEFPERVHHGKYDRANLREKSYLVHASFFESGGGQETTAAALIDLRKRYGFSQAILPLAYERAGSLKAFLALTESVSAAALIRKTAEAMAVKGPDGRWRIAESFAASLWTRMQADFAVAWSA